MSYPDSLPEWLPSNLGAKVQSFLPNPTINIKHWTYRKIQCSKPVQNTFESMKVYRQLLHRVQHRIQIHHHETLISSSQPSTMRSMTRSHCPHRGHLEEPLPLLIKDTNWPSVDEIDAYNGDLIVTIIEFIARHTIRTENHLISL